MSHSRQRHYPNTFLDQTNPRTHLTPSWPLALMLCVYNPYAYGLLLRWYLSQGTSLSTYTCRFRGLSLPTSQGRDIHKSSFMEYFQNFFKAFWKSSLDDLPFSKVNHSLLSLQVSCSLALRRLQVQSLSQLHSFTWRSTSCTTSCSTSRLHVVLHD